MTRSTILTGALILLTSTAAFVMPACQSTGDPEPEAPGPDATPEAGSPEPSPTGSPNLLRQPGRRRLYEDLDN